MHEGVSGCEAEKSPTEAVLALSRTHQSECPQHGRYPLRRISGQAEQEFRLIHHFNCGVRSFTDLGSCSVEGGGRFANRLYPAGEKMCSTDVGGRGTDSGPDEGFTHEHTER